MEFLDAMGKLYFIYIYQRYVQFEDREGTEKCLS